ncbi:hypothetical protein GGI35DRAFT_461941 [Trichoderma velutinum]
MAPHPPGDLPPEADKNILVPLNDPEGDIPDSPPWEFDRLVTELDREALLRVMGSRRQRRTRRRAAEEVETSEQQRHEPDAMERTAESELQQLDTSNVDEQRQLFEQSSMNNRDELQQRNNNNANEHRDNADEDGSVQLMAQLNLDNTDEEVDKDENHAQPDTIEADYQWSMNAV